MRNIYRFFVVLGYFLTVPSFYLFAQVGINDDSSAPNSSAILDVKSTNMGFLPPRMTHSQMNSIVSPANGLIIYCIDCSNSGNGALAMFISGEWYMFAPTCILPLSPLAGIHFSTATQIIWNWNTVPYATGYKWGTANNYAGATEMNAATTHSETGLTCNTAYTRYAWAYSACGNSTPVTLTQSTSACPFTCGSSFTDSRDNQVYTTVLIGSQCWMAKNLNIGIRINGTQEPTNNSTIEKYCYNDLESNCNIYGGLYQWNEMMQYLNTPGVKGICTTGWHIPTDAEWTTVTTFLGVANVAGGKMKSTGTIEAGTGLWFSPNNGATNSSGFTAIPAGNRYIYGSFAGISGSGELWSSSERSTISAWSRLVSYSNSDVVQLDFSKDFGFSVRCLRDM